MGGKVYAGGPWAQIECVVVLIGCVQVLRDRSGIGEGEYLAKNIARPAHSVGAAVTGANHGVWPRLPSDAQAGERCVYSMLTFRLFP